MLLAAASTSASFSTLTKNSNASEEYYMVGRTMLGFFPPNSKMQGFRYFAASAASAFATVAPPVNCATNVSGGFTTQKVQGEVTLTRRILGLPIISETKLGVVSFDIATKLKTPFGRPAFDVGFLAK